MLVLRLGDDLFPQVIPPHDGQGRADSNNTDADTDANTNASILRPAASRPCGLGRRRRCGIGRRGRGGIRTQLSESPAEWAAPRSRRRRARRVRRSGAAGAHEQPGGGVVHGRAHWWCRGRGVGRDLRGGRIDRRHRIIWRGRRRPRGLQMARRTKGLERFAFVPLRCGHGGVVTGSRKTLPSGAPPPASAATAAAAAAGSGRSKDHDASRRRGGSGAEQEQEQQQPSQIGAGLPLFIYVSGWLDRASDHFGVWGWEPDVEVAVPVVSAPSSASDLSRALHWGWCTPRVRLIACRAGHWRLRARFNQLRTARPHRRAGSADVVTACRSVARRGLCPGQQHCDWRKCTLTTRRATACVTSTSADMQTSQGLYAAQPGRVDISDPLALPRERAPHVMHERDADTAPSPASSDHLSSVLPQPPLPPSPAVLTDAAQPALPTLRQRPSSHDARALHTRSCARLTVRELAPGGAAEQSGIGVGDVILGVDGTPLVAAAIAAPLLAPAPGLVTSHRRRTSICTHGWDLGRCRRR